MTPGSSSQAGWGIIIILIGLILLAANFNWLHIDVWAVLYNFWPLILILIGLKFILKNVLIYAMATALIVGAAVWTVTAAPDNIRRHFGAGSDQPTDGRQQLSAPAGNAKRLAFNLDFNAGSIRIHESDDTARAYQAMFENVPPIRQEVSRRDDTAQIKLEPESTRRGLWRQLQGRRADIALNSQLPVEVTVDSGAGRQELDFSQIRLERLKLDLGASSSNVTFGLKAQNVDAVIDIGASSLALRVPRSAGLSIISDDGLSSHNFEAAGLTRTDDTFRSAGFDTQEHKITIRLDAGASKVTLERY